MVQNLSGSVSSLTLRVSLGGLGSRVKADHESEIPRGSCYTLLALVISHQPFSNTFFSHQISTSHQPHPAEKNELTWHARHCCHRSFKATYAPPGPVQMMAST